MNYNILNINYTNVQSRNYFFDSQIWLAILEPPIDIRPSLKKCVDFFYNTRSSALNPKPKIFITSVLLGEVINRYMQNVGMQKFYQAKNNTNKRYHGDSSYFKQMYRPSPEYKTDLQILKDDLKKYLKDSIPVNDEFANVGVIKSLDDMPDNIDYCDYYYVMLARKYSFDIVTEDGDFWQPDVNIITSNARLIEKSHTHSIQKRNAQLK